MNKLSELTVTVRTLEVNGKKMTQSFFRQLPISRVYNENEFTLRENIQLWGIVRYKIPKYLNEKWVLFESDSILYKGDVNPLNNIPSVEGQEVEVEQIKDKLKHAQDHDKFLPQIIDIDRIKKELVEAQMKLLKYINGYELVKKIKSLPQLFIAI